MSDSESTAPKGGQFHRAMGLLDSTAIVVGIMIGSGIFLVSAETARNIGSPFWFLMTWVIAGILTVLGATCYSELASMFPKAGGQYLFLREAYGKLFGFLYGWTLFMVIQSGTNAAVAVAFAKFLGVFAPFVSDKNVLFSLGDWSFTTLKLVALSVIALLTGINCLGISMAKMIQTSFTIVKVIALFLLILVGIFALNFHHGLEPNLDKFWVAQGPQGDPLSGFGLIAALSLALVGPLFAADAWNNITFSGEEVKEPEKTLPRSLILGTALVCVLYLITNIVYMLLLPLFGSASGATVVERGIQYASQDRVGTASLEVIFGATGEKIMAVAIMISTFGSLNGLILSGPRLYYAMAKDGLFFKNAGILHASTHVPVFGLILQGIWSSILATSGTYSQLLEYVIFSALLFYVLTVSAVFVMRKKEPLRPRPFKVPFYPFLPILYILMAVTIMVGQIYLHWEYSGAGLLIILSGLPVYWFWKTKNKVVN